MSDMPELLPCPFCGGKAKLYLSCFGGPDMAVECVDCGMGTHNGDRDEETAQWNRRAAIAELDTLYVVLRKVPNALNRAFSAGTEEREGGSARRQGKDLEVVEALRDEIRTILEARK